MHLAWLRLRDFRCYRAVDVEPDPGVNLLVGENGAGKTSLLEAIGYLATLTSFRRGPDASLVRVGSRETILRGEFASDAQVVRVEIELPSAGRRRVLLAGKRIAGRAEVAARVALVAFLPDDLDLVKRGPAYRREYLDDLGAQLWPAAAVDQEEYERAVRQRNALLRRDGRQSDPATLGVWDQRVAVLGAAMLRRRLQALERLIPRVGGFCRRLGIGGERVEWRYEGMGIGEVSPGDSAERLTMRLGEALAQARATDLERRATTVGPHRDEIVLLLDGRDVRTRASQGEQRTVALALRVGAYHLLIEQRGTRPVLLLDDVFSELDAGRGARLVEALPGGQVFVSTARAEDVPLHGARWLVEAGRVTRQVSP